MEYDVAVAYYTDLPLWGTPAVPLAGCASGDIDTYATGVVAHGELIVIGTESGRFLVNRKVCVFDD